MLPELCAAQIVDPSILKQYIFQKGFVTEAAKARREAEAQNATLQARRPALSAMRGAGSLASTTLQLMVNAGGEWKWPPWQADVAAGTLNTGVSCTIPPRGGSRCLLPCWDPQARA